MDALSCYLPDLENFDDEYYRFHTNIDTNFQSNSDLTTHPNVENVLFEQSYRTEAYPYEDTGYPTYPVYSTMTGPPSTANTESPVEEFQYIDFDLQSYTKESQALMNLSYSHVGNVGERERPFYLPTHTDSSSSTASSSPAPREKKSKKNATASRPPPTRQSSRMVASNTHHVSPPQKAASELEPASNIDCRFVKKPKGPPKAFMTVFEANTESQARRKSRSSFTEEGKKKVEAVRRVGACTECRFRKRPCGTSQPCQACIKRAGSAKSAATICFRESSFNDVPTIESPPGQGSLTSMSNLRI